MLLNHTDNRADISAKDSDGRTALHLAAGEGQGVVVKLLLERGARLTDTDMNGATPLDRARTTGHRGCELLMRRSMNQPLCAASIEQTV